MYSLVHTATLCGIDSVLVAVEADISNGMPMFSMVGFLASEVKESKDRVRTAMKNCGYEMPVKKITVNFSPANVRKSGSGFDLPVAIAVLSALDEIEKEKLERAVFIGELSLDGKVSGVTGVLSMVICAKEAGMKMCVVPKENEKEAKLIPDIMIIGVSHLQEVIWFLKTGELCEDDQEKEPVHTKPASRGEQHDFSEINGQLVLRRVCEIAISGMHNLLMVGPPGAGKTMVAKCIPSILPPMKEKEQIELSKIYSVCGLFSEKESLMESRPYRNPHHTITEQGLTGGGRDPKPGEISLAHGGVLFLDELTEFKKSTLEVLRQPLEDKAVTIARVGGTYRFPADFVLVAAMNPCNCGYYPDMSRCHCTTTSIQRHMNKLSQPLLDRIDLCVEVTAVRYEELTEKGKKNESSEEIRKRVCRMHQLQEKRFQGLSFQFNSEIPSGLLEEFCHLEKEEAGYMKKMYEEMELTARTYHKILRVARTIADMDGETQIAKRHLREAICYRGIDKSYWENCL